MNMEEDVKKWLSDENFMREVKYDENADFHYIIEFPKDNIMDVVKPKGSDSIVVACGTHVAQEHLNLMKNADVNTRKNFIQALNFGLNGFLVDFELQINQDLLQQFLISEQIFEDGLTKNELIKALKKVFKSKLHCILLIEKYFASPTIISNENDMFI